jgi:assimilatory nitrate reductase catalytic subunit
MTRTGLAARLSAHYAEPFAEIHPEDAEHFSILRTQLIRLESRSGTMVVRALVTARQQKGSVFVPMHWTGETAPSGRVNVAISPFVDPVSGQPALKMGEVSIAPVDVALYGFAISQDKPLLSGANYWALARAGSGWRTEIALYQRPEDVLVVARKMFDLREDDQLSTSIDARSGRISIARFEDDRLSFALYLSPDPVLVSRQWAVEQLLETHSPLRRAEILVGRPGADRPDPGPLVCSCFGVGANQIADAVSSGQCQTVEAVGAVLKAGTNCGSCRTDIRRLIDANRLAAAE